MDNFDAETVFLCRDLAVLYHSRGQRATVISIYHKNLEIFWPQILSDAGELLYLPDRYAGESINLVVIMAQMYKLTSDEQQAKILLGFIVRCYKQHVLRWGASGEDVANTLECSSRFSAFHHFTLQIAAVIARLSLQLDLDIDDEGACGVFEAEPEDDDLESTSVLIEGLFDLCKGNSSKKRGQVILKWYELVSKSFKDTRPPCFRAEYFCGYTPGQALRATCMPGVGRQDIWYLRASLELTKLLEMDEAIILEAADVHDNIIEICFGLYTTDEAILSILNTTEERLSVSASSKPVLYDRPSNSYSRPGRRLTGGTAMRTSVP
ncbi:hypothetical protein F5B21DRAFT_499287 [Xylaria acuta]|nr:hypothetical protein F5B21DRAFT_499287 [Xylaria acuta]